MKLRNAVDIPCPWCGIGVAMGVLALDPSDTGIPASEDGKDVVIHQEPQCPMFSAMDGDSFVEAVRDHRAARRGVA